MKRRFSPQPSNAPRRPEPTEAERTAAVVKWLGIQAAKHRAAAHSFARDPDNQEAVDHENRCADVIDACCEVLQQNRLLAPTSIHGQVRHPASLYPATGRKA
jgi:hypothetical protein